MKLLEFLIQDSSSSKLEDLQKQFSDVGNIKSYNATTGNIIIETDNITSEVENSLSKKFSKFRLVGQGSKSSKSDAAGVAIVGGPKGVKGVVRLLQNDKMLTLEGNVSGLQLGEYSVSVNEYGDISDCCKSTGNPIQLSGDKQDHSGIVGSIYNDGGPETKFLLNTEQLQISDCVGRSLVLQKHNSEKVACGIVGRSPGIFENTKKFCACDGKVIWEEQVFGQYAVAPPSE